MEVIDAIKSRISIRCYKPDPIPRDIMTKVLDVARFSPSGTNTQPWEFYVVTGKTLENIKSIGVKNIAEGVAIDEPAVPYSGDFRRRQVALGIEMFRIMGIQREDKKRREEWVLEGMRFFGAPAVIWICLDKAYYQERRDIALVNIGVVTYAITLAALEFKLGTCIQFQGLMYAREVQKALNIPETKHLASCLSIGYPDWNAPINSLRSERESVEKLTTWID